MQEVFIRIDPRSSGKRFPGRSFFSLFHPWSGLGLFVVYDVVRLNYYYYIYYCAIIIITRRYYYSIIDEKIFLFIMGVSI